MIATAQREQTRAAILPRRAKAAALLLLAPALTLILVAACGGAGGASSPAALVWVGRNAGFASEDTLTALDPRSGEVVRSLPVESLGEGLVVAGERIWTVQPGADAVLGIDPRSGEVQTIQLPEGSTPAHLALGEGALWVACDGDGNVVRIDLASGQIVATIRVTQDKGIDQPLRVAVGEGAVWVVDFFGRRDLHRIDPATNQVTGTVADIGDGAVTAVVGAGSVWVASVHDGMLTRVDPQTLEVTARVGVGPMPLGVAYGAGAVWVANRMHGTVARVDPASNRLVALVKVGSEPAWVAVAGGSVWVTDPAGDAVARIDPATNEAATLPLEGKPTTIAAAASLETQDEQAAAPAPPAGLPPLARELGFAGDACALLTLEEVAARAGKPVIARGAATRWDESSCTWAEPEGTMPVLELQVSWTEGREGFQVANMGIGLAIKTMEGPMGEAEVDVDSIVRPGPVPGLGDAAFYSDIMPSLVLAGDTLLHFAMQYLPDAKQHFAPLARSALARLGGGQ